MIEKLLLSLAKWFVGYLVNAAVDAFEQRRQQLEEDRRKGEINDANIKAYEDAKDSAARRQAALDLLNGTRTP